MYVVKINELHKLIFLKNVLTQPFTVSGSQKGILTVSTWWGT